MNISTVRVEKPSQIEQGALYIIRGTDRGDSTGLKQIPPQVFRVETPVIQEGLMGRPHVRGTTWFNPGRGGPRKMTNTVLYLDAVGVFDGFSTVMDLARDPVARHIVETDVHLERVYDDEVTAIGKIKKDKSYKAFLRNPNIE